MGQTMLWGRFTMHRLRPAGETELRLMLARALVGPAELRFLHRVHAVLLVSVGRSCYEVAHWFGEHPRSVERWVHAFDALGEHGLRNHHHGGRSARLALPQLHTLAHDLAALPSACGFAQGRWSGKLVARHIHTRFGVQLSLRQCQRLMRQMRPA